MKKILNAAWQWNIDIRVVLFEISSLEARIKFSYPERIPALSVQVEINPKCAISVWESYVDDTYVKKITAGTSKVELDLIL